MGTARPSMLVDEEPLSPAIEEIALVKPPTLSPNSEPSKVVPKETKPDACEDPLPNRFSKDPRMPESI